MKIVAIASVVAGLAVVASASAFAVEGPKPATPAAKRSCFFPNQVNNWSTERGEKVAYLYVGVKDVYRADLLGSCNGLDNASSIGVKSRGGGASICDGLDVDLLVRSPIGPQRCAVTSLTKLTPEQVAALKASKKAK